MSYNNFISVDMIRRYDNAYIPMPFRFKRVISTLMRHNGIYDSIAERVMIRTVDIVIQILTQKARRL